MGLSISRCSIIDGHWGRLWATANRHVSRCPAGDAMSSEGPVVEFPLHVAGARRVGRRGFVDANAAPIPQSTQAASVSAVAAAPTAMPAESAMLAFTAAMLAFAAMLREAAVLAEPPMPMRKAVAPATVIPALAPTIAVSVVAVTTGLRHASGQGKTDADQQQYGPRQYSAVIHRRLHLL
jgi:hypothetical protein